MKRCYLCVFAIAALLAYSGNASAGLVFTDTIKLNFSVLGAGADVNFVNALEFGSSNQPGSARFAFNGSDTNGSGVFDAGDTGRLVGHGLIDQIGTTGGNVAPAFTMTAQLRNVNTVLAITPGGALNVFQPGTATTGLLDVYVKSGPFVVTDADTSNNGTLAATFRITSGGSNVLLSGTASNNQRISSTDFIAELVFNNSNFVTLTDGSPLVGGLNVFTNVVTVDRLVSSGNQSLQNINGLNLGANKDFSGSASVLNIGAGFNPATGTTVTLPVFDVVTSIDGNAAFAVVPEPASIAGFTCLVGFGLNAARRRRK